MDNQQPVFRVYISSDGIRSYIGCQSGTDPEYKGSYSDQTFKPIHKFIVGHFTNREEAGKFEKQLILELDAIKSPFFVNRGILPVKSLEDMRRYALEIHEKNPELREILSQKSKELWQDEAYLEKQKEAKKRLSKAMIDHWADPEFRANQIERVKEGTANSPIWRQAMKEMDRTVQANSTREFFKKLKENPEEYRAFIDARVNKAKETKARKAAQRLEETRRANSQPEAREDSPN